MGATGEWARAGSACECTGMLGSCAEAFDAGSLGKRACSIEAGVAATARVPGMRAVPRGAPRKRSSTLGASGGTSKADLVAQPPDVAMQRTVKKSDWTLIDPPFRLGSWTSLCNGAPF